MRFVLVSERILLTLWVGGLWSIGYMAVPTIFATLDSRAIAGNLAGEMFHIISYMGLVCGALLLIGVLARTGRSWQFWVILAMIGFVSCGEFLLQPMMQELKIIGMPAGTDEAVSFRRLHGISQVFYLVTSLMGLALVVFGLQRRPE